MTPLAGKLDHLTAARAFAALAVVLYHVDAYLGGGLSASGPRFIRQGPLGVDFFFILSGFILAHVYGAAVRSGRFAMWPYIAKRIARIYPLHLATLAAVAALYVVASRFGIEPEHQQTTGAFAAHALLLHATGILNGHYFNQPSWSVSAEWFAYLLFPAMAGLLLRGTSLMAKLVFAAALLVSCLALAPVYTGRGLFELTYDFGILRILPAFAAGIVLRDCLEQWTVPRPAFVATGSLAAILAMAQLGAPAPAAVAAMIPLIAALACCKPSSGIFHRAAVHFGETSYALYLVHAPVLMVTFGVAQRVVDLARPASAALGAVAAVGLALAAAEIAHRLVEVPGRRMVADRLTRRPVAETANN